MVDLKVIEQSLRAASGALLVDPRVLRQIIKRHRRVRGLVPHAHAYTIDRDTLYQLVTPAELPSGPAPLPQEVIILARPSPRVMASNSESVILTRLWRTVFHARVHQAFDRCMREGKLDEAVVRARIHHIGPSEFDEVRGILRHDDRVLPPNRDLEVYIEFAALYLELRYFAPGLLITTFPGLTDHHRVEETFAQDIDVAPLLDAGRPTQVPAPADTRELRHTSRYGTGFTAVTQNTPERPPPKVSARSHGRHMRRAAVARAKGNDVRAALLCGVASHVDDKQLRQQAEAGRKEALEALGTRLTEALRGDGYEAGRTPSWTALLAALGDRASRERSLRFSIEARLLYRLQIAAVTFERPHQAVDLPGFLLSFGKRKVVRPLDATRELRVARQMHSAAKMASHVRLPSADRKLLDKLLSSAAKRADKNIRAALRPRLFDVLQRVGLVAASGPERLARDKLIEELLDYIVENGFLSFSVLRDTISRNQLKLRDLRGAGELWRGDPLLAADRLLDEELDGIYRRSDVYLRGLQKASSVPFGTRAGRLFTLWLALPLGGAAVTLKALHVVLTPLLGWVGVHGVAIMTPAAFAVTALLALALIHSRPFRAFATQLLEIIGIVLATLFFRIPRFLFNLPLVRQLLSLTWVRLLLRSVITPLAIALVVYWLLPLETLWQRILVAAGIFFALGAAMASPLGIWVEDFVVDQLAPTWQMVRRQWLPGLFRLIGTVFSALMGGLERAMFRVDEVLRFSEGGGIIAIVFKATVGFVWAIAAYVVRLYVTLLVEPELNPLKHFPIVTVAHKVMIPVSLMLVEEVVAPLEASFGFIGGAIGGITVFLIPSMFGFLAWELKENYKLYAATRPEQVPAAAIGPHGETMRGLLVPGFHSGTLPKLYERLRRAAQREDRGGRQSMRERQRRQGRGLETFRKGIRRVGQSVRHFVERELCAVLAQSPRWRFGPVVLKRVELSSNRIRATLVCKQLSERPCELTIEEQSGYLMAGTSKPGFLVELQRSSRTGSLIFENALAGLYQRAEIDIVHEQLIAELGGDVNYDISDDGLLVWPEPDFKTELLYRIHKPNKPTLVPIVRGAPPKRPPPTLDTHQTLFRKQSLTWPAWVTAWSAAERAEGAIARVIRGPSLLPPPDEIEYTPAPPSNTFRPVAATVQLAPKANTVVISDGGPSVQ